jgi:hypothetical protein
MTPGRSDDMTLLAQAVALSLALAAGHGGYDKQRVERFGVGRDRWTIRWTELGFVHYVGQSYWERDEKVRISRNGQRMLTLRAGDVSGYYIAAKRVWFPVGFPVIAVRGHSANGHGEETRFYGIRHRRLYLMGGITVGENGGPIFRDLDGDGRMEWIFDDYTWYGYYGDPPRWLLVYRLSRAGRLVFWKKLPNRTRKHLPRVLGDYRLRWPDGDYE